MYTDLTFGAGEAPDSYDQSSLLRSEISVLDGSVVCPIYRLSVLSVGLDQLKNAGRSNNDSVIHQRGFGIPF